MKKILIALTIPVIAIPAGCGLASGIASGMMTVRRFFDLSPESISLVEFSLIFVCIFLISYLTSWTKEP